jgi:DNA-directed RNA polymerase specialized sigma24 family protein
MKHTTPEHTVEYLFRQFQPILVGYVLGAFPRFSVQNTEDVVQNLFVTLQRRDTRILGDCSLESLKKHAYRHALDFIRREEADKRGADKTSSLDVALDAGFEPISDEQEPEQERYLRTLDSLDEANRIIDVAIPLLPERELILVQHIRSWAPMDLSVADLSDLLTPSERLRFLPTRRPTSLEEGDDLVVRQISRSKASLHRRLREVRDSMGNSSGDRA